MGGGTPEVAHKWRISGACPMSSTFVGGAARARHVPSIHDSNVKFSIIYNTVTGSNKFPSFHPCTIHVPLATLDFLCWVSNLMGTQAQDPLPSTAKYSVPISTQQALLLALRKSISICANCRFAIFMTIGAQKSQFTQADTAG